MLRESDDTEEMLRLASAGDARALGRLLVGHSNRLRHLVAVRMGPRLRQRLDPSDIVQEALADAGRKLDGYVRDRPLAFLPWLKRLAMERLIQARRTHQWAARRAVDREAVDASGEAAVDTLPADDTSPSRALLHDENRRRLRAALDGAEPNDREVLTLRYIHNLSFDQIAASLGLGLSAVKMRHLRALERLRSALSDEPPT